MKYFFHPDAEEELNLAIDYYQERKLGLGYEFATEIYKTIQRVMEFPNAWQCLDDDIRRCLTNRFPFGIIYYQKDNSIIILAVMHMHQKPNYWQERITKTQ
jgi:plasmid stabilization system protein ParE